MKPFTPAQVLSLDHMSDPETPLGWRRPNVHPMTELRAAVLESRRRAARWFKKPTPLDTVYGAKVLPPSALAQIGGVL